MNGATSDSGDSHRLARILGYTTLRLAMGMSMLMHGLGRLPKATAFTEATVKMFASSPLPPFAVTAFARVTPPVETLIGVLVFFGIATRFGLTLGGLWMVALTFGSTLIEKYDIVGIQLVYSLIFFVLLQFLEQNALSIDAAIARRRESR
jgi:thiosulfate dehydrogenase [quinone] large subunit